MKKLTIGIPVYDDYDGVFFTLQALRFAYRLNDWIEFLVVDNNPDSIYGQATRELCEKTQTLYIPHSDSVGTSVAKNMVFESASSEWVMCIDSHVLVSPEGLDNVFKSVRKLRKDSLYHGVLVEDGMNTCLGEMEPKWRGGMYGIWGKGQELTNLPSGFQVEVNMHGMGLFLCHKDAWLGFNKNFIGFGGEEGYIHKKFRQNGGKVFRLNSLHWVHRFTRPDGPKYPNTWEDRIGNYFYGFQELGRKDLILGCVDHFQELLGTMKLGLTLMKVRQRMGNDFPEM